MTLCTSSSAGPKAVSSWEINTLTPRIRDFIHDLEARADPAGDIRALAVAQDTILYLEARLLEQQSRNVRSFSTFVADEIHEFWVWVDGLKYRWYDITVGHNGDFGCIDCRGKGTTTILLPHKTRVFCECRMGRMLSQLEDLEMELGFRKGPKLGTARSVYFGKPA